MITEIKYTYPSPTINLGGSEVKRSAEIWFDVCIDSAELTFRTVLVRPTEMDRTIENLDFIVEVHKKIKELEGKRLVTEFGEPIKHEITEIPVDEGWLKGKTPGDKYYLISEEAREAYNNLQGKRSNNTTKEDCGNNATEDS